MSGLVLPKDCLSVAAAEASLLLKRAHSWLVGICAAASISVGAQSPVADPIPSSKIIIGMLLPPEEAQAQSLREGMLLAADQGNATAVIRGRAGQWGADGVEAAAMVFDDQAMGLIAPPSGAGSHLALQVAGRTAIPIISMCADSSVSQTGVPWMTRIVPATVDEARILLSRAGSGAPDAQRWSAVVPSGRPGREIAKDLAAAATETGCRLQKPVEMPDLPTAQSDLPHQLMAGGTTSILVWLDPVPAARIVKALRGAGFKGTLAGPGWLDCHAFITAAGSSPQGFVIPAVVREQECEKRFTLFSDAYRTRFGHDPDTMALYSYDAANLLLELLHRFGSEALRRGTPPGFELVAASGVLRFDALGNRKVNLQLLVADEGRFTKRTPPVAPTGSRLHLPIADRQTAKNADAQPFSNRPFTQSPGFIPLHEG